MGLRRCGSAAAWVRGGVGLRRRGSAAAWVRGGLGNFEVSPYLPILTDDDAEWLYRLPLASPTIDIDIAVTARAASVAAV